MAHPQVQWRFNYQGLLAACTFTPSPASGRSPTQVAADAKLFWDNLKLYVCDLCTLVEIAVHIDAGDAVVTYNDPGTFHGTGLPQNCAAVFTKLTTTGRRGRLFWPGVPASAIATNGTWASGAKANYNTAAAAALAAMEAAGTQMHVEHKVGPTTHVTGLALTNVLGTQRRRLRN